MKPRGTPNMIVSNSLVALFMRMHCFLLERYEFAIASFAVKKSCGTQLKTLGRS